MWSQGLLELSDFGFAMRKNDVIYGTDGRVFT